MMENYESDDTFLARWIAGELSEEERADFEKTDAFKEFDAINNVAQNLQGPEINTEEALRTIKAKLAIGDNKPKVFKIWYAIAASIALILALGVFMTSAKTYETKIGEKLVITLSDGSRIDLNSNSSISHQRYFWTKNKEVTLKGEALFSVVKGDGFKVHTSKGTVDVLGTQFNILDREIFELKCQEGKVRFDSNIERQNAKILTKGMSVSVVGGNLVENTFTGAASSWVSGKSTFTNAPFKTVLEEFKNYYPVNFEVQGIDLNRRYTGSFVHDNIETALQTTFLPMGIIYKKSNIESTYILTE